MVKNSHSIKCYSVRNGRVYLADIKLPKGLLSAVCEQLYDCLNTEVQDSYLVKSKPSFCSMSYPHLVSAFCALVRDLCIFRDECPHDGIIKFKGIYRSFFESKKIDNNIEIVTSTRYYFDGYFYYSLEGLYKAVNQAFPPSKFNNHLIFT